MKKLISCHTSEKAQGIMLFDLNGVVLLIVGLYYLKTLCIKVLLPCIASLFSPVSILAIICRLYMWQEI